MCERGERCSLRNFILIWTRVFVCQKTHELFVTRPLFLVCTLHCQVPINLGLSQDKPNEKKRKGIRQEEEEVLKPGSGGGGRPAQDKLLSTPRAAHLLPRCVRA